MDSGVITRKATWVRPVWSWLKRYYSVFLLLAIYEALGRLGLVPPRLFPSLIVIGKQLWKYLENGDLIFHASITLYRALVGFLLAFIVGGCLGTAMARSRLVEVLVDPIFRFGYPIPKIALYPVFIFIFGFGTESKIALVFLECLFPIAIHFHAGILSTPKVLIWAAENMGASRIAIFFRVLLPAALPMIFTGIRIALPVALIITIVTEIIGESQGLGYFVTFASASYEYARALAAFALIAFIGFVIDRLLLFVRDRVVFWRAA